MFEYYQHAGALEKYIWFYGTQIKMVFAMKGRLKKLQRSCAQKVALEILILLYI